MELCTDCVLSHHKSTHYCKAQQKHDVRLLFYLELAMFLAIISCVPHQNLSNGQCNLTGYRICHLFFVDLLLLNSWQHIALPMPSSSYLYPLLAKQCNKWFLLTHGTSWFRLAQPYDTAVKCRLESVFSELLDYSSILGARDAKVRPTNVQRR
jgi:hypothetical protein